MEPNLPSPSWWTPSNAAATPRPRFVGYPFTLGVASGSPRSDGMVLWTRLAPDPLHGGGVDAGSIEVTWQVATDERFARVVATGIIDALPGRAHSVHVEVTGLEQARWYFYRFRVGDDISPVGRTRTAPSARARVAGMRFAVASCQQFEQGYFAAHRHIADEGVDLVVHLGDYIYESSWGNALVRRHSAAEPSTLAEYRNRHAQYKTDRDLQRAHAAAPWLVTWDDHEVENDYAGAQSEALDPQFLRRRSAAYQAYFEHMPLREAARPMGSEMTLYSRHDFGRLARFHVLDGRQYRSPQACPRSGRGGANIVDGQCRQLFDADRTMLGRAQEQWLAEGLRESADRWNVLAQATLMTRADPGGPGGPTYWTDAWDGYPAARTRLLSDVAGANARSCLVLSGDSHSYYAADVRLDPTDTSTAPVASEVNCSSVTSQGRGQAATDQILAANPHISFADSERRGYAVVDLTADQATIRLRALDTVKRPDATVSTLATFTVAAGTPGIRRVTA